MTTQPSPRSKWAPEHVVDAELAARLIESQCAGMGSISLQPFGAGWDNTAYLVNESWVFRFPRRAAAVELIETEIRVLPQIAHSLPLPISEPEQTGAPDFGYPWPWAGYRLLKGSTATKIAPNDSARCSAAVAVGAFLSALHSTSTDEARRHGAPADTIARTDVALRRPRAHARLDQLADSGVLDDTGLFRAILDDTPIVADRPTCLVHGDFDARHILLDDDGHAPSGVIDWGDLHTGDPALDLAIAHSFLPRSAHDTFREAYGTIDDVTWRLARFRALHHATMLIVYGMDVGDDDVVTEAMRSLRYIARS